MARLLKILLGICLPLTTAWAATVTYPGVTAPYDLAAGDTLNVTSGTMATPSSSATGYTIQLPGGTGPTINISAGATVSYSGTGATSTNGSIFFLGSGSTSNGISITNNGTISAGVGTNAIYYQDTNAATTRNITVNNKGTINGAINLQGASNSSLYLNGSITINGSITLAAKTAGGVSQMEIGIFDVANFSSQGTITISGGSGATVTIWSGSTFSLNNTLSFSGSSHLIENSGTLNLSANVTKSSGTLSFANESGSTVNIRQAISVGSTTYVVSSGATHNAVLTDVNNYGHLTLTTATPSISLFKLVYAGGYFPAGNYTLLTAPNSSVTISPTIPTATMFLSFSQPFKNSATTIQTTATRTGFQTYAQNPLTYQIAEAMETFGADSPSDAMVALLDALEASSSADQLQSNLTQLEPLVTGPIAAINIQNQPMKQATLHLDAVRADDEDSGYASGNCYCQNGTWIRGFGDRANQSAVKEIQGYSATNTGIAFGVDQNINDKTLFGIAGSYSLARVKDKSNSSSLTKIYSYQALVYGSYNSDIGTYFDFAFDAGFNDFKIDRYVNINPVSYLAQSSYWGQQYSAIGILGRPFSVFADWQTTPEMSLQYTYAPKYSYAESGGGVTNLNVSGNDSSLLQVGAGGKIIKHMTSGKCTWAPEFHGMVLYNIFNGNLNTVSTFAAGSTNISANYDLPRSSGRLGLAFTFAIADQLEFKANYDCEFRSKYIDNAFYLNFRYLL